MSGENIGYARVSSTGQSLDIQISKLEHAGCQRIYQEKKSGANSQRPQLQACLDYVREGDRLFITKLDRMARSVNDLTSIADLLEKKGVALIVLDQDIDTNTPTGKLLFNMLGSIAEFELSLRAERQQDGIDKAKQKGVTFGRPPKLTDEVKAAIKDDLNNGLNVSFISRKHNIGKTNIYKVKKELREERQSEQT